MMDLFGAVESIHQQPVWPAALLVVVCVAWCCLALGEWLVLRPRRRTATSQCIKQSKVLRLSAIAVLSLSWQLFERFV
eukprot:COSAG06_NODE_3369_length_5441_cov_8.371209_6_plen_78_part_00